ncbi:MAG: ferredoxin--NADP reductase [Planctomycetota bacterium]
METSPAPRDEMHRLNPVKARSAPGSPSTTEQVRPSPKSSPHPTDTWTNATIVERVDLNEELALFRLLPDAGVPKFEPGQFVTLGLPDGSDASRAGRVKLIRRAYSVASSPTEERWLELYIVLVTEGKLTPKLWELHGGDRLWVAPRIGGRFTLNGVADGRTLVMVGTGTGVAPFHAMYLRYRKAGRWSRFVLFDGCRYVRDLGYREEFERYAAEDPSLVYLPTVTREAADHPWPGLRGRVTEHLEPSRFHRLVGEPLVPETCSVFLCGNPQMIDQCEALLGEHGFHTHGKKRPEGTVHLERYW